MQLRPLSATELLDLWESGYRQSPLLRALMLLHSACPDLTYDTLAQLSIGRRDRLLILVRGLAFGNQLDGVVECPTCGERTEFSFDSAKFDAELDDEPPASLQLDVEGYRLDFRLPNTTDMAAIATETNVDKARIILADRCLLSASRDESPAESAIVDHLPEVVLLALADKMNEVDPLAEIQLDMTCPACAYNWLALFDILTYFWQEIDEWARRTLRQIHSLAYNYGWSEADILSMSAWRRRAYLEMVVS